MHNVYYHVKLSIDTNGIRLEEISRGEQRQVMQMS